MNKDEREENKSIDEKTPLKSSQENKYNKSKWYVIGLLLLFFCTTAIPLFIFSINPQAFYFRSWEYFPEVVYHKPSIVWDGYEQGSSSRMYFFRFQESWYTHVSCDEDGWRTVPYPSDDYKILVLGDSQTWGSGLSDNETFPWLLAEDLKIPVFNGAKGAGSANVFKKPSNRHVNIVVHVIDLGQLNAKSFFFTNWSWDTPYIPPVKSAISPPLKRYNAFGIRADRLKTMVSELWHPNDLNEYMLSKYARIMYNETNKAEQVQMIANYDKYLKEKEYLLVFVLMPDRSVMYADSTDEYSLNYPKDLTDRLKREGVHVVDLSDLFYTNKDNGMYLKTDSHWSPNGTRLAADYVSQYLISNHLINKNESTMTNIGDVIS